MYVVEYNKIDIFLCASLAFPELLWFVLHWNWFVLIHGITIGTLSILADGLHIYELLFWFFYGMSLVKQMSFWFITYEITLVTNSIICHQCAKIYFYKKKNNAYGIFYQRLLHIGAISSMASIVIHDFICS